MGASRSNPMIQELQQGDQKVLAKVYRLYRKDFLAWMQAKYGCDPDIAREVYQNTMVTLSLKARDGTLPDLESSLKTYIYGIAKNKYREHQRTHGRFVYVEDESWKEIEDEEMEDNSETKALVGRCLQKLGDPCKTVLELYYFHGMSMEEIKEHLSYKNSRTAKNMKYKCLLRLKGLFQQELNKKTPQS